MFKMRFVKLLIVDYITVFRPHYDQLLLQSQTMPHITVFQSVNVYIGMTIVLDEMTYTEAQLYISNE